MYLKRCLHHPNRKRGQYRELRRSFPTAPGGATGCVVLTDVSQCRDLEGAREGGER